MEPLCSESPSVAGRSASLRPAHVHQPGSQLARSDPARPHRLVSLLLGAALLCGAAWPGVSAHAQEAAATDAADQATTPALPAEATTAPAATTPLTRLNPDEARRLMAQPTPAAPASEINLPPTAERQRLSHLRETLQPPQTPEAALRVKPLEGFLNYSSEDQMIYSPGRTRIRYGRYYLEADKLILDLRLQEVQAEGNVVLKISEQSEIKADKLRYNFRANEGQAYNVSGSYPPVYFRAAKGADPNKPQFEKVSREESYLHDVQVTSCDFKIPHYYVRGREVVIYQNDRVFFRGATFYAWGVPLAYLPVYSRSLTAGSPWSVQLGYSSTTGARARVGYTYRHRTLEPSFENENQYEVRNDGTATAFFDYLTKRGPGMGFDYDYMFNFGKSRGQTEIYGLSDRDRNVVGPSAHDTDVFHESDRWRFMWRHQTQLTPNLNLLLNIDEFSDPDIFYDVLDQFGNDIEPRNRVVTRRGRGALTWVQEAYVARLMIDVKDRIGLNRFNDYSNPTDNDLDFNLVPYPIPNEDDINGISAKRWGRVSEKLPQFDLASRYLPAGHTPLYWTGELHLYNNLDKGLNVVSRDDDAFVQGGEFYQQLMRQWRLSERYTLLGKLGVGVGSAERDDDSLGIDFSGQSFPTMVDALTFINPNTFRVGKSTTNFSLSDINPFYAWSDEQLLLNARFSDALNGMLRWRARQTTNDFIGDFYAQLGDRTFREDLYNYPIRENWIEGNLTYRLFRPLITLSTAAGANLIPQEDLYPNEPTAYWNNGINWANQRQTLTAAAGVGMTRRQIFEPNDPDSFEDNIFGASASVRYAPIHQRWYTLVRAYHNDALSGGVNRLSETDQTVFSDEEARDRLRVTYGRELGPKYTTEFMIEWDKEVGGIKEAAWLLQRDLHDAVAILRLGLQSKDNIVNQNDLTANQLDVRLGLKLKLPDQKLPISSTAARTLRDRTRQPELAY